MADSERLQSKIKAQKKKIDAQEAENARLKTALLSALLAQKGKSTKEGDVLLAMDPDAGDEDVSTRDDRDTDEYDDGETDEEDELQEPIDDAGVPRCVRCAGEVVEGACHFCATEHVWVPELYEESNATDSHVVALDRSLVPRGDTPLCDAIRFKKTPHGYSKADFTHLLKRGATRLMVETFSLEFTPEDGIFAWADQELFDEFSGPAMKVGHKWRIHLGRKIMLDEDDLDGSEFVEGLLEDALLFPVDFARWETMQEVTGIWTTRMGKGDAERLKEPLTFEEEDEEGAEGVEGVGEEGEGDREGEQDTERPIVDLEYYEATDVESDDSEEFEDETLAMVLDVDSGWAIRAGVDDASWSDAEMDEEEEDEDEEDTLSDPCEDDSMDDGSDMVEAVGTRRIRI